MNRKKILISLLVISHLITIFSCFSFIKIVKADSNIQKWIVAADSDRYLYKFKLDGSAKIKLLNHPIGNYGESINYLNISGDGTKVLVAISSEFYNYLRLIDLNNGSDHQILFTDKISWIWRGKISRDGLYVCYHLYSDNEKLKPHSWIMSSNGSNKRQISINSGDFTACPDFSYNSNKVTFVQKNSVNEGYSLYVMNVDGSSLQKLSDYSRDGSAWNPSFSNQDNYVFCPLNTRLIRVEINYPGNKIDVANDIGVWAVEHSQDGSKIAYVKKNIAGYSSLWTINSDGTNKKQITIPADTTSVGVRLSPDAEYVIYSYFGASGEACKLARSDGTDTRNLSDVIGMSNLMCADWFPQIPPFPPRNVTAIGSNISITLNWNAASPGNFEIKGYKIFRRKDNEPFSLYHTINQTDLLTFEDKNVVLGAKYCYSIKTFDENGNESDYSNEACAELISTTNEKLPILLVHGHQLGTYNPIEIWAPMVAKLTGNTNNIYNIIESCPVKSGNWNIYYIKAIDSNHYDVFISDYAHNKWFFDRYKRWRTAGDIREYAKNLSLEIQTAKDLFNLNNQNKIDKIDIIAHSMGGLVARAYIESDDFKSDFAKNNYFFIITNEGKILIEDPYPLLYHRDVRRLIMIGTPNHGTQVSYLPTLTICGSQMSPNSSFLKVLNYNKDINFSIDTIKQNPDLINTGVDYYTITGVIPRLWNCKNFSDVKKKLDCYYEDYLIIKRKIEENPDQCNLYNYSDGTVPANSVRIYSNDSNIKNYHYIHSDHCHIRTYEKNLQMTKDLSDNVNITPVNYWEPFHIAREAGELYSVGDLLLFSPVSYQIVDSSGRKIGNIDGLVNEIPGAFISELDNTIQYFNIDDPNLSYQIQGLSNGVYGISFSNGNVNTNQIHRYTMMNVPVAVGQNDKYEVNWDLIYQGKTGLTIYKDVDGNGIYETIFLPPGAPLNFKATQDYDVVNLNWEPAIKGTYPIKSYRIYKRLLDNDTFDAIAEVPGNTLKFSDTSNILGKEYEYYVVAVDDHYNVSFSSNIQVVGPILQRPKPILLLSPELNRNEYYPSDEVIIKMQIMNKGNGDATNTKLTMTLPQDLDYVKADLLRGSVFGNSVEFNVGKILAEDTTTFYIYCKVKSNIRNDKSVDIIFDVTCKEGSTDRRAVHLLIKPKRGEVMPLSIGVYLKNIKSDPDTGEAYIDFDTSLELTVRIDGGSVPYTIKIDWGDGSSKEEKKVDVAEVNLTHKFESRGTIEIKFEVIDSVGRSKKATVKLKVK